MKKASMGFETLGERSQMIMQCVWENNGPTTIMDIIDGLEGKCGVRFSQPSINTLVLMLVEKGYLKRGSKIHQAFTFTPLISEEEFRHRELERIKNFTFHGSSPALVKCLVEGGITKEDLDAIKEIIDKHVTA